MKIEEIFEFWKDYAWKNDKSLFPRPRARHATCGQNNVVWVNFSSLGESVSVSKHTGLLNYHRLDGPAVFHEDGTKEWWVNGKKLTSLTNPNIFKSFYGAVRPLPFFKLQTNFFIRFKTFVDISMGVTKIIPPKI